MQRYFLKSITDNELIFYDSDIHHIKNVMRYKIGDLIEAIWDETI